MQKNQIMKQMLQITGLILLNAFLLLGAQHATAQSTQFRKGVKSTLDPWAK